MIYVEPAISIHVYCSRSMGHEGYAWDESRVET
jgi:hypothetical protein